MTQLFGPDKIFTVTEISLLIKEILQGTFPDITVEGEISNLKTAPSGHTYFDLKDRDSLIPAVMFKGYQRALTADLQNGQLVEARGEISSYQKSGKYQLIVKAARPKATGNLYLEFEKLKARLAAEGLFDESRKKPIPPFPKKIGVVTSPTGAAIRDIISVLRRRNSSVEVLLYPVLVQGTEAKNEIAAAIKELNRFYPDMDVMLVGRGGGSMEDLWSFNEEIVARAIAASKIPVISCVGHETDFTIADFVADLRAPTPSAAAELVVRHRAELSSQAQALQRRLIQGLSLSYERVNGRLRAAQACPYFKNPERLVQDREQHLDTAYEQLSRWMDSTARTAEERVNLLSHKLAALNPSAVLGRGYAIVRRTGTGEVLARGGQAKPGDEVSVQLHKGSLDCVVRNSKE